METISQCPLDCPDACSLRVETDGNRLVALDGDYRNPLTAGFICGKVRSYGDHIYGDDRLTYPMIRDGEKGTGAFRRASWDEALDLIVERFQVIAEHVGSEAILPFCYGGSNGMLTQDSTDARFFRRLGASNLARTVCAAPATAAGVGLYGKMPGVALEDYEHADLIVVWGCNPGATGIHLLPFIQRARERGARLVVVDPRRNKLARGADLHLGLRPGSDVAVALAIANWLFETGNADLEFLAANALQVDEFRRRATEWPIERAAQVAGLDAADIETLARWYVAAEPAVIRAGWGMERNRNGGSAIAAVIALPAIAGKFGVRGGGYTMSNTGAFRFDATDSANQAATRTRTFNMNRLGRILLEEADPPVNALFVYNCNPAVTLPDQERVVAGLQRNDLFTVVFEQVMTDTCRYADVLLPATTFLEHDELRAGYGSMVIQRSGPVIDRVGEARPNYEVFADLCTRMGLAKPDDPSGADALAGAIVGDNGVSADLARSGIAQPRVAAPIMFVDEMPRTADGKVHLIPEALDAAAPAGLYGYRDDPGTAEYPLALISPATNKTISSTLGQLRKRQVALQIHPDDAASRGLVDGGAVRVFNALGEVRCAATITDRVRAGVVFLPKGLWSHNTLNGKTSNALVPDDYTDLGDGAVFNDARVQVEVAG